MLPAPILEGLLPGLVFGGILGLALDQGLVGDAIVPDITLPGPQVDIELTQQLPGPMQRPSQVRHTPADPLAGGLGGRAIKLPGGGQQHLQGLLVVQVRIALHHQGQGPGGMGRSHGRAVVGRVAATGHRAGNRCARCRQAPVFGDAALVVFLLVVLVQPRDGQPMALQVRLEVRQPGAHAGIGITAVAGAEDIDHPTARDLGRGIQPGPLLKVLGVGRAQAVQGLVADILGLAAPAVVDGAYPGVGQGPISGREVLGVRAWAEQETVVVVGVAHIYLGIEGHAVHAIAIARRSHGAGDMGAMAVVGAVEDTGDIEWAAIQVLATGGDRMKTLGAGFGMGRVEPGIQGADLDPGTGDAGRIGLVRLHAFQAPVLLVFGRTPTGGIALAAGLLISRRNRQRQSGGKRQAQGARQRLELIRSHIHVDDFSCFCCWIAHSGSIDIPLRCLAASLRPYRTRGAHPPLACYLGFRRKRSLSR